MNIVIRADASLQIGSGHIMRCLTLANYLKLQGHCITFICREHNGHLMDTIIQKGFGVRLLKNKLVDNYLTDNIHCDWLGVSEMTDFIECQPILTDLNPNWLIIDHYAIGKIWQQNAKQNFPKLKIMVIDDLADREHYCDVLLDQNIMIEGKNDYKNLVPAHCQLLLGSQYCLLREEFHHCTESSSKDNKVFAYFGGTDPKQYSQKFIEAFYGQNLSSIYSLELISSKQNQNLSNILSLSKKYGFNCVIDDDNIAKRMNESKFAVIACGFACYELASLKVPAIYFASSDIQRKVAQALTKMGIGVLAENDVKDDFTLLFKQLENTKPENFIAFDTQGVARVAQALIGDEYEC